MKIKVFLGCVLFAVGLASLSEYSRKGRPISLPRDIRNQRLQITLPSRADVREAAKTAVVGWIDEARFLVGICPASSIPTMEMNLRNRPTPDPDAGYRMFPGTAIRLGKATGYKYAYRQSSTSLLNEAKYTLKLPNGFLAVTLTSPDPIPAAVESEFEAALATASILDDPE